MKTIHAIKNSYFYFWLPCIIVIWWIILYPILAIFLFHARVDLQYWSIQIVDKNNITISNRSFRDWYHIPYTWSLNNPFVTALLDIEDKRFYKHYWVDILAKFSALYENIVHGKIVRWWSTITEQFIKNTYFPHVRRTILQKIRESILALFFTLYYSKEQILRQYLDTLYLWNNIYWIGWALEVYISWSQLSTLSNRQIGYLLTLIKYPWTENIHEQRFQWYLYQVWERLWLTSWWDEWVFVYKRFRSFDKNPLLTQRIIREYELYCSDEQNFLFQFIQIPINKHIFCSEKKLVFYSFIDQEYSERIYLNIQSVLSRLQEKKVWNAAVYIFHPTKKQVIMYIWTGDFSWKNGSIDMIQQRRSVWSVLKPFLTLLALQEWAEMDSYILDDEKVYPTGLWNTQFLPMNYNLHSYGPMRLKEVLWNSLNMASVRLAEYLWIQKVYDYFQSLWIHFNHDVTYYGYWLVIGSPELTLENVVWSFSHIYTYSGIVSSKDVFLLSEILSNSKNRSLSFWAQGILNTSNFIPVKTWTSTDFRDNWAVWFFPDFVAWVWVGNSDASSMLWVSWISWAGPIWHNVIEEWIARWYMRSKYSLQPPLWLQEFYYCLDIRCFQKERSYTKSGKKQKSFIIEEQFSSEDFFVPLNWEEKQKWNIQ